MHYRFVSSLSLGKQEKQVEKEEKVAKKILVFSLPTKATTKELRITLSLLVVVICHVCLTIPHTIIYLFWTAFPQKYMEISDDQRVILAGLTDALLSLNYSINFYLHFVTNQDVRTEVLALLRHWKSLIC